MKLEVGMYVRTKWGIAKYVHKAVTKETIYRIVDKNIVSENEENWQDALLDSEIIKASYNIIDLIEVGDYVNGKEVVEIHTNWLDLGNDVCEVSDIKTIVTKEQFESMKYSLEV